MKIPTKNVIDFTDNDEEGIIAREQYKTNNHVLEFVELLRSGYVFPPIEITKNNILIDGMHRLMAHRILNIENIDVEIIDYA